MLRGKLQHLKHIGEEKRSEINHPSFHLNKLGKYEQIKSKVSRKKYYKLEQKSMKLKPKNQQSK